MSISIIKDNTITYPTDVYSDYNIYLITEYEKFATNSTKEHVKSHVNNIIYELQDLLLDNTKTDKLPFAIMDWEEKLNEYFTLLDESVKYRNEKPIKTIDNFLRKAKIEKLNTL